MALRIIDVSENNGTISWSRVRGHVDGVIVRAGYRGWDGWQYSWKGRVPGISTDVDMNQFDERSVDMTKEQVLQIIAEYEVEKAKKPVSGYAKQAWQDAKKAGVLDGTSPQGGLTREQLAAVLSRLGLIKSRGDVKWQTRQPLC